MSAKTVTLTVGDVTVIRIALQYERKRLWQTMPSHSDSKVQHLYRLERVEHALSTIDAAPYHAPSTQR